MGSDSSKEEQPTITDLGPSQPNQQPDDGGPRIQDDPNWKRPKAPEPAPKPKEPDRHRIPKHPLPKPKIPLPKPIEPKHHEPKHHEPKHSDNEHHSEIRHEKETKRDSRPDATVEKIGGLPRINVSRTYRYENNEGRRNEGRRNEPMDSARVHSRRNLGIVPLLPHPVEVFFGKYVEEAYYLERGSILPGFDDKNTFEL